MPRKSIEGSDWQLVTVGGAPAVAGKEATMAVSGGRVTGSGGCNRYNGSYTLGEAGAIAFGPAASTMMACVGPVSEQEQAFFKALEAVASYTISGDTLTLMDADGAELMTLTPREATALVGTTWSATGINNGRHAVVSLVADSEVTAVFGEDGMLAGKGGCNRYRAAYTVDGNAITIKAPMSTRMACPDPNIGEQETHFLNAIIKAATWRIDGDKLELRDEGGALQVGFRAQK